MPRTPLSASAVVFVVFVASESKATAQEVQWRHDYAAARREATETGKPLFFDFGTENCGWCRKLDATTFRDPRVVKLLNERFIPVKIDADKHAKLTSALGIESYPTLVLATPEGKVAGRHPGYADAAEMTTFLAKAPAPAPAAAPRQPIAAVPPTPAQPTVNTESDADKWRRVKEQIDADLAALHPKIVTSLER